MSNPRPATQKAAVAAALAKLDIRPTERVLIMLPDGPGFAEAFAGIIKHGAVPLPVNPLLFAHDIVAAATESGARLLLASVDQIHTLTDLSAEPPVLIDGPQGRPWAAALLLSSKRPPPPRPTHQQTPSTFPPPAQPASDSAPTARERVVLLPHAPINPTDTSTPPAPHTPRTTGMNGTNEWRIGPCPDNIRRKRSPRQGS